MKKMSVLLVNVLAIVFFISCPQETETLSSINFLQKSIIVAEGEEKFVYINCNPSGNYNIIYNSSNNNIAILNKTDSGCVIKGLQNGKSILIAECQGKSAYIEITIENGIKQSDPYIVLPFVDVKMERGLKKTVIASLYGGIESENSLFEFKTDSKCVEIDTIGNACVVTALKTGYALIEVSHPKSKLSSYFSVIIPSSSQEIFYLTTESNVIIKSEGTEDFILPVSIVGGTENDKWDLKYRIKSGNEFISIEKNNVGECYLTCKKKGKAQIEIVHEKAQLPLYIDVVVTNEENLKIIETENDFVEVTVGNEVPLQYWLMDGENKEINININYEIEDESKIKIENIGNILYIKGLEKGKSKVILSSEETENKHEILVNVIEETYTSERNYIKSYEDIIYMEVGDEKELDFNLIGGNEADRNSFIWEVSDLSMIDVISSDGTVKARSVIYEEILETKCIVVAKKVGKAQIVLKHPKSVTEKIINVHIYNKGTLTEYITIDSVPVVEGFIGNNYNLNIVVNGNIGSENLEWTIEDETIISIENTNTKAILNFLKKGFTSLTINHSKLKTPHKILIYVKETEEEESNYFYLEKKYFEFQKDTNNYIEINAGIDSYNFSNIEIVVKDTNICNVKKVDNILVLELLQEGLTEIILKDITTQQEETILILCKDVKTSYDYPYYINLEDKIIQCIKNKEYNLSIELINATEEEYNNILLYSSENIHAVINEKKLTIICNETGQFELEICHPKVKNHYKLIIQSYETEEELKNDVLLYSEKTHYLQNIGDKFFIEIEISDDSQQDAIIWNCTDAELLSLEVNGKRAFIQCKKSGNCVIQIYVNEEKPLYLYVSIKESEEINDIETYIECPSVIEMIVGSNQKIELNTNINYDNLEVEADNENIEVIKNNNIIYIQALKVGITEVIIKNEKIFKKIVVVCAASKEELKQNIVINIPQYQYIVKKGNTLSLSLSFGTIMPDDIVKSEIEWITDSSLIELVNNGEYCTIKGIDEGIAKIKVRGNGIYNEIEFDVIIIEDAETEVIEEYFFIVERFHKILKDDVKTISYSLYDINNNPILDYSSVKVTINDEKIINYTINGNVLRIEGKSIGQTEVTIEYYTAKTKLIIGVYETEEEINNESLLLLEKENVVVYKGSEVIVPIYLEKEDNENVIILSEDISIASVNKIDNYITIKGINFGTTQIKISYQDKDYYLYVTVPEYCEDESIITENIILMEVGESYTTQVITKKNITEINYNDEILKCDYTDNKIVITSLTAGITELKVRVGNSYRVILIYSGNDGKNFKGLNLAQRYYKIKKYESLKLLPFSYPIKINNINTVYEDISKNNVCSINNTEGILEIIGKEEGIHEIKIINEDFYTFSIYIEVADGIEKKEEENEIEVVEKNFYLQTDKNALYCEENEENVYLNVTVFGEGEFVFDEYFVWEVEDDSIVGIENLGSVAHILPLKEGETQIICRNSVCSNFIIFKVIVGDYLIKEDTEKLIFTNDTSVSLEYGSFSKIIPVYFQNIENIENFEIKDTNENIISFSTEVKEKELYITIKPLLCGYGQLVITHPNYDSSLILNYIVNDVINNDLIFLTTNDNHVYIKPGEYKNIGIELKNYEELNISNFNWNKDNDNIEIIGNGENCVIKGIKEGVTYIKVNHPLSENTISICVHISETATEAKYITYQSNLMEISVSQVLESFEVGIIGGTNSEKIYVDVSDATVLATLVNGTSIYYRGLKEGLCQLKIYSDDNSIESFTINFIVTEIAEDSQYLTSSVDGDILYLEPYGSSSKIEISSKNIENFNSEYLSWSIYSQNVAKDTTGGNVISIVSNKDTCVVTPLNEGIAKIKVEYLPLKISYTIIIHVSSVGELQFTEENVELEKGEVYYVELDVPSFSNNQLDFIEYSIENSNICSVIGTGKVCCIKGLKKGNTIIKALNKYDNTFDEIVVNVTESDTTSPKIYTNYSSLVLNPRSENIDLRAFLIGEGFSEIDNDTINWTVKGNQSVSLYPNVGSEVILSLKEINGEIIQGEDNPAIIELTSTKCESSYKKTIYVQIQELDNFFYLDKNSFEIDISQQVDIEAHLLGGTSSDYNDIHWTLDGFKINEDGTKTEIARLLVEEGNVAKIYSMNPGTCVLSCFYEKEIRQCSITVKSDKYFTLVNNSLYLYPGQEYELYYNLRPATYVPTWYSSDDGLDEKIIECNYDSGNQKVIIKALNEGVCTLTGFVNGIGTVTCSIQVKYSPRLVDLSENKNPIIKMYDKGTTNYINKGKNSLDIPIYCYPEIFYLKVDFSDFGEYEKRIIYSLTQNQNSSQLVGDESGKCNLHIELTGEVPKSTIVVTQYKDKELTEPTGNILEYEFTGYYVKSNGERDYDFDIYLKRNDGYFTAENKDSGTNYRKKLIPLYENGLAKYTKDSPLNWGDGEDHYIVIKPRHEGQIIENLQLSLGSPSIAIEDENKSNSLKVSGNVKIEDGLYLYGVNSGKDCDVGFDCDIEKITSGNKTSLNLFDPDTTSDSFYPNFCYKDMKFKSIKEDSSTTENIINSIKDIIIKYNYSKGDEYHNNPWSKAIAKGCNYSVLTIENFFTFYIYPNNKNDKIDISNRKKYFFSEVEDEVVTTENTNRYQDGEHWDGLIFYHYKHYYKEVKYKLTSEFTNWIVCTDKNNFSLKYNHKQEVDHNSEPTSYTINFTLFKDQDWIDSGNAYCSPSLSTSVNYSFTQSIQISASGSTIIIPCKINIRNCYRNIYGYDSGGNKTEEGKYVANDKYKTKGVEY